MNRFDTCVFVMQELANELDIDIAEIFYQYKFTPNEITKAYKILNREV